MCTFTVPLFVVGAVARRGSCVHPQRTASSGSDAAAPAKTVHSTPAHSPAALRRDSDGTSVLALRDRPSRPTQLWEDFTSQTSRVGGIACTIVRAAWSSGGEPSSQYLFGETVMAGAVLLHSMTSEGDSGLLFSRVVWSDGESEDVGYSPVAGVDEVGVGGVGV